MVAVLSSSAATVALVAVSARVSLKVSSVSSVLSLVTATETVFSSSPGAKVTLAGLGRVVAGLLGGAVRRGVPDR